MGTSTQQSNKASLVLHSYQKYHSYRHRMLTCILDLPRTILMLNNRQANHNRPLNLPPNSIPLLIPADMLSIHSITLMLLSHSHSLHLILTT